MNCLLIEWNCKMTPGCGKHCWLTNQMCFHPPNGLLKVDLCKSAVLATPQCFWHHGAFQTVALATPGCYSSYTPVLARLRCFRHRSDCDTRAHATPRCLQHCRAWDTAVLAKPWCLQHHGACNTVELATQWCLRHCGACNSPEFQLCSVATLQSACNTLVIYYLLMGGVVYMARYDVVSRRLYP